LIGKAVEKSIQGDLGIEVLQGNSQIQKKLSKKHKVYEGERAYTERLAGRG
jgi:hypothetical protein